MITLLFYINFSQNFLLMLAASGFETSNLGSLIKCSTDCATAASQLSIKAFSSQFSQEASSTWLGTLWLKITGQKYPQLCYYDWLFYYFCSLIPSLASTYLNPKNYDYSLILHKLFPKFPLDAGSVWIWNLKLSITCQMFYLLCYCCE